MSKVKLIYGITEKGDHVPLRIAEQDFNVEELKKLLNSQEVFKTRGIKNVYVDVVSVWTNKMFGFPPEKNKISSVDKVIQKMEDIVEKADNIL